MDLKAESRQSRQMNWEMAAVTYLFMILFVLMAGYVIWFLSGDTAVSYTHLTLPTTF